MGLESWVGTIEISYFDWEAPDVRKCAFTVVTTWACNAEEFRQKCDRMLESYVWKLLEVDKANPAPENYDYKMKYGTNWKGQEAIQMQLFMGRSTRTL
jgi:hypothetical protein